MEASTPASAWGRIACAVSRADAEQYGDEPSGRPVPAVDITEVCEWRA